METRLASVSLPTVKRLEKYSFFTATFRFSDLLVVGKQKMSGKHAKFLVADGAKTVEAVVFNDLSFYHNIGPGDRIDVIGGLSVNTWRSRETIQIMIRDVACRHFQCIDLRDRALFEEALPFLADGENAVLLDDRYAWINRPWEETLANLRPGTVVLAPTVDPDELAGTVSKEGLAAIFRALQKRKTTTGEEFRDFMNAPSWTADAILATFVELGFVAVGPTGCEVVPAAPHRNLNESATYQQLESIVRDVRHIAGVTTEEIRRIVRPEEE
jgi:hypothetical protein